LLKAKRKLGGSLRTDVALDPRKRTGIIIEIVVEIRVFSADEFMGRLLTWLMLKLVELIRRCDSVLRCDTDGVVL